MLTIKPLKKVVRHGSTKKFAQTNPIALTLAAIAGRLTDARRVRLTLVVIAIIRSRHIDKAVLAAPAVKTVRTVTLIPRASSSVKA